MGPRIRYYCLCLGLISPPNTNEHTGVGQSIAAASLVWFQLLEGHGRHGAGSPSLTKEGIGRTDRSQHIREQHIQYR
jgi:hypothetical protein